MTWASILRVRSQRASQKPSSLERDGDALDLAARADGLVVPSLQESEQCFLVDR
ncbi:hypothetical protein [Mesorhizobium sp.]|uniref:hypothetical protein n=1 Tax=Mesorhizobium sp. TaxID=1871066 RepID=UPI0025C19218|nr:hypothetical protein [Mesorhizobium sp.]